MAANGRVTIREVADRAGVSPATVSRVLSGNYPVPPATRARVLKAAQSLDYVANAHARALVGRGRSMVAVVLRQLTSPFYAQVAEGVEAEAADHGRLCLVGSTGGDPRRETELVQLMREEGAGLVILVGGIVEDDAYRERVARYAHALKAAGSRLVLCGRPSPDPDIPAVVVEFDNEAGARAVTSHLVSAGHRRIVFLGGLPGNSALDARVAGYRAALAEHGIDAGGEDVVDCGLGRGAGHRAMTELLSRRSDFTAVFAGDDMVAAGAMRAVTDAGLRVPDDISVVGYNDIPLAQDFNPPLTTVRTPAEELGRAAVRLALRDADEWSAPAHHVLGTHIVVRDSVGAPAAHRVPHTTGGFAPA
ncbi:MULTISPECIES: LacI family DNA-binding transcriptional regulator [unclassified Streptomyces]|uniref:LacI family DNA-binding transcriptional regulator n=1 Tax=unclassified Streptomyces TaxID=2593676 RepID=UPI00093B15CC|nr:LacI family DNA-binding transcriptional regulator [Streptomyces sp. CB02058]OKI92685.1 LacI family transcriptional regulator [Streptomyces sp. CB02058]